MPIINHADSPELEMRPGIRGRFLAHEALGSTGVSLLTNTVEPGAEAPLHVHTVEETMVVLEGSVWAKVGGEIFTVQADHTVIIPPGTPHAWGNSGDRVAKLLWAFAGPDPFSDATYLNGEAPKTT
ncbi:MAG: cupin domain-containing protein [Chromatiales bacterium]|jgi:quercetin dioxygenase-like cupin family protein|nr:cupin domain-containing protein [Chromatiales bacterium]